MLLYIDTLSRLPVVHKMTHTQKQITDGQIHNKPLSDFPRPKLSWLSQQGRQHAARDQEAGAKEWYGQTMDGVKQGSWQPKHWKMGRGHSRGCWGISPSED